MRFVAHLSILFLIITVQFNPVTAQELYINEYMASNATNITDEDGDTEDWIELYYSGDEPLNLEGFGFSDNYSEPFKWVFPNTTIHPGEFMLVWASGKDRTIVGNPLHTNFRIASAGEELLITHPDGSRVDERSPVAVDTDLSYGRQPDGTDNWYFFATPTPGFPNANESFSEVLVPPIFSSESGFYKDPVTLCLSHPSPGVTIYYTTDGSKPDENSDVYTESILLDYISDQANAHSMIRTTPVEADSRGFRWMAPDDHFVEKAHTIRAIAKKEDALPSRVTTGTWFIDYEKGNHPVLSLTADHDDFFSHEHGIYVPGQIYEERGYGSSHWGSPNANYFQRGDNWEREASLEWFEDGNLTFQQNIGVRIHGGASRVQPLKSLRLYARNEYDATHFQHHIFPGYEYDEFKRLILRASGQDFYLRATMLRDAFMQSLVDDLSFDTQAYRPIVLFLNGEYWGIMNVRERYDRHFFERKYGVQLHDLNLLTSNAIVQEGSRLHYNNLRTVLDSLLIGQEKLKEQHYQQVTTMMDVQNFLDYYISQMYFNNRDWPGNNIDFWRYSGDPDSTIAEKDGRWRWLMYDTDFGFALSGGSGAHAHNMMEFVTNDDPDPPRAAQRPWATFVIRALLESNEFRENFIIRKSDLLNANFQSDRVKTQLNNMAANIESEMHHHQQRWKHPESMDQWYSNLDLMRTFAERRPNAVRNHLIDFFEMDGSYSVEIDVDAPGGYVSVNTLDITADLPGTSEEVYPWTGTYFSGMPLTVTAKPHDDYEFKGWLVNGQAFEGASAKQLTFYPDSSKRIVAHFNNVPVSADRDKTLPNMIHLAQNYPNPFNPKTVIDYQLPVSSNVRLEVFDILGRRVAVLIDGQINAGNHSVTFDATQLSSGVYIYRLTAGDVVHTRKMLLLK